MSDASVRATDSVSMPYKLAVLVFIENTAGEQLLIHRAKAPNRGAWSPIGGKLETGAGESPYECAIRETREETGFEIATEDLHLFCMIAEKSYEGSGHWLMFLFRCKKPVAALPPDIDEGRFGFFTREAMERIHIPDTDRRALWPVFDKYRDRFVTLRVDCDPAKPLLVETEEIF